MRKQVFSLRLDNHFRCEYQKWTKEFESFIKFQTATTTIAWWWWWRKLSMRISWSCHLSTHVTSILDLFYVNHEYVKIRIWLSSEVFINIPWRCLQASFLVASCKRFITVAESLGLKCFPTFSEWDNKKNYQTLKARILKNYNWIMRGEYLISVIRISNQPTTCECK